MHNCILYANDTITSNGTNEFIFWFIETFSKVFSKVLICIDDWPHSSAHWLVDIRCFLGDVIPFGLCFLTDRLPRKSIRAFTEDLTCRAQWLWNIISDFSNKYSNIFPNHLHITHFIPNFLSLNFSITGLIDLLFEFRFEGIRAEFSYNC